MPSTGARHTRYTIFCLMTVVRKKVIEASFLDLSALVLKTRERRIGAPSLAPGLHADVEGERCTNVG